MVSGHLHQVSRNHRDLDQAERFYGEVLGLRRIARFDPPGLLFFDLDGVRLLIVLGDPAANNILYLRTDDLDGAVVQLRERGVAIVEEPKLVHTDAEGQFGPAGEEEWMAAFHDHDGGVLVLTTRR